MSELARRRPAHATVVAYLALFIALGGTAWALQANSVRSKHIVDGQVKSPDLRESSVNSTKVANNSLTGADIDEASLSYVIGLDQVRAESARNPSSPKKVTANCPAGKRAIGAGADLNGGAGNVIIDEILPSTEHTVPGKVSVSAIEDTAVDSDWRVVAIALCAKVF